jgi:hypothetical protein
MFLPAAPGSRISVDVSRVHEIELVDSPPVTAQGAAAR